MTTTVLFQIQCLILLQPVFANQVKSQPFTSSADYNYQRVTNDGGKNVYDDPCPSQGIVIESLQIGIVKRCSESGSKHILNNAGVNEKEKLLVKYIQKECTGRPQCQLQETWNIRPTLKCNGSQVPIDKINIKGRCLQTNIDNKTVFDLQQIQKLHLLHNVFIISQSQKINRICQLSGHAGTIKITLLLLDFDTTESENTTQLFSINDSDTDAFLCLNPKIMSNLIQHAYTSVKNATMEVVMNNGFLWMEIEAQNTTSLVCEEHYPWTSSCFKPTGKISVYTILYVAQPCWTRRTHVDSLTLHENVMKR
uniref:SUEL-type lectin domain-containing protein n=1 Tax=Biomphalaria glabrata TaxID=6526 RepID=A0A2C9KLN0_BIOGL